LSHPPDIRIIVSQPPSPKAEPIYSWPGRYGLKLAAAGTQSLFLTARDGSFLIGNRGDTIHCFPKESAESGHPSEGLCQILMRRVLPRVAQLRGRICFHGASVTVDAQEAILLLGPSRAGKSTLSTALNRQLGWHILGDDISIIDNTVIPAVCFPVVSGACLWPDSFASSATAAIRSSILPGHDEKRWCEFAGEFPASPATVRALIFINSGNGGDKEMELRQLPLTAAMMSAMHQLVRFNPSDASANRYCMESLGRLLQRISAYTLSYPRSYETLPKVVEYLRSHFETSPEQIRKGLHREDNDCYL
jgi:energy-coupling factor transporter ATP-binding protein EcfA2